MKRINIDERGFIHGIYADEQVESSSVDSVVETHASKFSDRASAIEDRSLPLR